MPIADVLGKKTSATRGRPWWQMLVAGLLLVGLSAQEEHLIVPPSGLASAAFLVVPPAAGSATMVGEAGDLAKAVRRISVETTGPDPWHAALSVANTQRVLVGDSVVLRVRLRSTETAAGQLANLALRVYSGSPPWTSHLARLIACDQQWQDFAMPFVVRQDCDPGQLIVVLGCSGQVQTVEISQLTLERQLNPAGASPSVPLVYPGREASAQWRSDALDDIVRLRTQPLTVRVRDAGGQPLANATVIVRQKRHAFVFGDTLTSTRLAREGGVDDHLVWQKPSWFNAMSLAAEPGEPLWLAHPVEIRRTASTMVEVGLGLRLQANLWPRDVQQRSPWLPLPASSAGIHHYTADATSTLAGMAVLRDLLASIELGQESGFFTPGSIQTALHAVQEADPDVRLITGMPLAEVASLTVPALPSTVTVGLRLSYDGAAPPDLVALRAAFIRLANLGRPCEISALRIAMEDQEADADVLRDVLIVAFANPHLRGVTLDGVILSQVVAAQGNVASYVHELTPAGRVWQSLVAGRWWTVTRKVTDSTGEVTIPVFMGDHDIEIETTDMRTALSSRVVKPTVIEVQP